MTSALVVKDAKGRDGATCVADLLLLSLSLWIELQNCFLLWIRVNRTYFIKYWQIILCKLQTQNTWPQSEISEVVLKIHRVDKENCKAQVKYKEDILWKWTEAEAS